MLEGPVDRLRERLAEEKCFGLLESPYPHGPNQGGFPPGGVNAVFLAETVVHEDPAERGSEQLGPNPSTYRSFRCILIFVVRITPRTR